MTTLTVAGDPGLRRLPVPVGEPRPALRIVPDRFSTDRFSTDTREPALPTDTREPALPGPAAARATSGRAVRPAPLRPPRVPPPAAAWARQFVQAALEAAGGRRPVSQLIRWTSKEVFAMLARRASLATRLDRNGSSPSGSCLVRSMRLCSPTASAMEASAVVVDRGRYRAVALRLEDAEGRWRVTALEIG